MLDVGEGGGLVIFRTQFWVPISTGVMCGEGGYFIASIFMRT